MRKSIFVLPAILLTCHIHAQTIPPAEPDSSVADSIPVFNAPSAWLYLDEAFNSHTLWRTEGDSLKTAIRRLLDQTHEPFDSVSQRLGIIDLTTIPVHRGDPYVSDSVATRWLNDSTFVIDPEGWSPDLYLIEKTELVYPVDLSTLTLSDSLLDSEGMLDSTLFTPDTLLVTVIDTAALKALEIGFYQLQGDSISPPLEGNARFSADSANIYYFSASTDWLADEASPFMMLSGERQLDSLQHAIHTLLDFTRERDSTLLIINDMYGLKAPLWISGRGNDTFRFWVKNFNNDSITLWIGNPASNEISLQMEDDVNFSRLMKEDIEHLPLFLEDQPRNLRKMKMLEPEPIFWDYELSNAFSMSQTYLSNWSKGGESSFSTMLDITGRATYNNKETNSQWINMARLKFGTIMSEEKGFRKNHDQFEIDSKFNKNASGKIGMSASFYMKQQLAKGYKYPNDSVAVSKFLNPGTMTIGLGAEFKPMANTTVNVAPFSYKTTFVLDTANIDQTKYGIDQDKWAKREMGTQVVFNNKFSPLKWLDVTNKVRLFSNYLNKPQNIDVDWEMIVEKRINWFFTIRLNMHLIYDDDVHFKVLDADQQPVLNPDGSEKEVAKAQFKEFIGLSLSFKF